MGEIRIRAAGNAEFAIGCGGWISEVAGLGNIEVVRHVSATRLTGRRVEIDELDGGADDVGVGEAGRQHAVN